MALFTSTRGANGTALKPGNVTSIDNANSVSGTENVTLKRYERNALRNAVRNATSNNYYLEDERAFFDLRSSRRTLLAPFSPDGSRARVFRGA